MCEQCNDDPKDEISHCNSQRDKTALATKEKRRGTLSTGIAYPLLWVQNINGMHPRKLDTIYLIAKDSANTKNPSKPTHTHISVYSSSAKLPA